MIDLGYVKLHRKLWNNPRSADPEWIAIWVYLICAATHKPIEIIWNGNPTKIESGQLVTGRLKISKKTGVSPSKTYRILKRLEIEQQIEQQKSNKSTLITIRNWSQYQVGEQQIEQQVNNKRTTDEQQVNTNKNNKNNKNNNKTPPTPPSGGESERDESDPGKDDEIFQKIKAYPILNGLTYEQFILAMRDHIDRGQLEANFGWLEKEIVLCGGLKFVSAGKWLAKRCEDIELGKHKNGGRKDYGVCNVDFV